MGSKETGRTMLEMIAVIVLIILLSIGSLMGYKQVVARHQATVLHQDIMVEASSRRGDNAQKKSTYDSGLGHKTRQGLAMETERSSDTFTIIVKEVSAALCSSLKKKDWDDALRIKINGNVYKPNDPNQIQCPSGDDNFELSLIFPYKVSAIEAYQDFCRNESECMSCQTCNTTTGTCQNTCGAGTCVANVCVGQACEEGETLVGTTCQPCKTDYSATCSSCNSTTTPYWTEDKKCVCHGDSCGTNFYCDTNGACQECPKHATCADGTFTCDTGYVKSELGDSCVALSCSKGETLVGTACQPCQTDYSATCSSCNSTTPYWNGTECTEALPERTCTDNTDCKAGEYCNYYDYSNYHLRSGDCRNGPNANSGVCLTADVASGTNDYGFTLSANKMDWFSAEKFCESLNKTMISLGDLHITLTINGATGCSGSSCPFDEGYSWDNIRTGNLSNTYWWTKDLHSYESCYGVFVYTYSGYNYEPRVYTNPRTDDSIARALCR